MSDASRPTRSRPGTPSLTTPTPTTDPDNSSNLATLLAGTTTSLKTAAEAITAATDETTTGRESVRKVNATARTALTDLATLATGLDRPAEVVHDHQGHPRRGPGRRRGEGVGDQPRLRHRPGLPAGRGEQPAAGRRLRELGHGADLGRQGPGGLGQEGDEPAAWRPRESRGPGQRVALQRADRLTRPDLRRHLLGDERPRQHPDPADPRPQQHPARPRRPEREGLRRHRHRVEGCDRRRLGRLPAGARRGPDDRVRLRTGAGRGRHHAAAGPGGGGTRSGRPSCPRSCSTCPTASSTARCTRSISRAADEGPPAGSAGAGRRRRSDRAAGHADRLQQP